MKVDRKRFIGIAETTAHRKRSRSGERSCLPAAVGHDRRAEKGVFALRNVAGVCVEEQVGFPDGS